MENWKNNLKGFGSIYASALRYIRLEILQLTSDEINQLIKDCDKPTASNCWWAVYYVAPLVKYEAELILTERGAVNA